MSIWFSKPKGSVVRSLPDWNIDKAAAGSGKASATGPMKPYVALYNDSTRGEQFWIYACFTSLSEFIGGLAMGVSGTVGSLQSTCQPVVIGNAALSGKIYSLTAAGDPGTAFAEIPCGQACSTWGTAPMFVLPSGYSLVVGFDFSTSPGSLYDLVVGFYYLVQ